MRKVPQHGVLPIPEKGGRLTSQRGTENAWVIAGGDSNLRASSGTSSKALEFLILTAARSGEVLGARWHEIDLPSATWTVPAERMKAGREHRVPLSRRALEVDREMYERRTNDFVFPGDKQSRGLSSMALAMTLRRMKIDNATVHGFRSAFRDWAAERTSAAREVCEAALAHTNTDKVEAAYRRTDLFEKRRKLMESWAQFNGPPPNAGEVIPMMQQRERVRASA